MAKGKFVQSLVKSAEEAGLLDMSEAARMARAQELGFDTDNIFYSGNMFGHRPESISRLGHEIKDSDRPNIFGGMFASKNKASAESHGDTINEFVLKGDILRSYDLKYDSDLNADKVLDEIINEKFPDASEEQREIIYDAVISDEDIFGKVSRGDIEEYDVISSLGGSDIGEASWNAQGLRGEVARRLGYPAVEMSDEHGVSYLLVDVPGKIRRLDAAFDPAKKDSPSLLASAVPAAVGIGGTAAILGQSEGAQAMPEPKGRFAKSLMDTYLKQQVAKPMTPDERLQYGQGFGYQGKIEPVQNEWAAKAAEYSEKYNKWRRDNVHPVVDMALPVGELPADVLRKMSYGDKVKYMDSVMAGLGML